MMEHAHLTVRGVQARPLQVPLSQPHQMAGGTVGSVPLVLIDLITEEGITGVSYVFCFAPFALGPTAQLIMNLASLITGHVVAPLELERTLRSSVRLIGPEGLVAVAMAGIDMAAWDALAKAAGLPLSRLLGARSRPIPAYAGIGRGASARMAADAEKAARAGFRSIKAKMSHASAREDLAAVRALRNAVGDDVLLMVDYNQALSVAEAIACARVLDAEGLTWIEEPTAADDDAGHARIAREAATPIQLGENWWGPRAMARSLAAEASDFAMLNAMKIGGVSGWLRASALAQTAGMPVSSHIFPEISAHLLAATPTAHWLEYHEWASPILQEPLRVEAGEVTPSLTPGTGLAWDEAAVRRFLIS